MKKITTYLLSSIVLVNMIMGCKKEAVSNAPEGFLVVTNAVVGGAGMMLGSNLTPISNNNFAAFAINANQSGLYCWPTGNYSQPYFQDSKFSCAAGETYSLFVCGPVASPEGFYVKDNIPYLRDSSFSIRFVNLAPSGGPYNITRNKTPLVNEVSNLTYKQLTDFKLYPGKYNSSDTFQVRSPVNPNVVLADLKFTSSNLPRFANITFVIYQSGTSVAVRRVNNDR